MGERETYQIKYNTAFRLCGVICRYDLLLVELHPRQEMPITTAIQKVQK